MKTSEIISDKEVSFLLRLINDILSGSTELIANLFRISQTEEKLRKDEIQGANFTYSGEEYSAN